MNAPGTAYRAHCIFCGYDAEEDRPDPERCPRCHGSLFLELDLEQPRAPSRPKVVRVKVGARRDGEGQPSAA